MYTDAYGAYGCIRRPHRAPGPNLMLGSNLILGPNLTPGPNLILGGNLVPNIDCCDSRMPILVATFV